MKNKKVNISEVLAFKKFGLVCMTILGVILLLGIFWGNEALLRLAVIMFTIIFVAILTVIQRKCSDV